jgi:transketolase C-terminal domain/subunit
LKIELRSDEFRGQLATWITIIYGVRVQLLVARSDGLPSQTRGIHVMANVVDPNSWRMIPLPDSQQPSQSTESIAARGGAQAAALAAVSVIASALETSFDAQHDRVQWNLAADGYPQPRAAGQRVRVDQQHEIAAPAVSARFVDAAGASRPWLVLIESASELRQRSQRLRSAAEEDAQLLVIVCDLDSAAPADVRGGTGAARLASQLNCDYLGPFTTATGNELSEVLARVKQSGRPTLLYVDARAGAAPPPHFSLANRQDASTALADSERLRHVAAETLAELERRGERVRAFSTDVDPLLPTAWETYADDEMTAGQRVAFSIAHCAELARDGIRPYLFLSLEETLNHLGQIRVEIATKSCGVTLVVEARPASDSLEASSAHLAGVRQLPATSLLSPKDGTELAEMLRWCAGQNEPAIVWLPEAVEPPVSWPRGSEIALGHAEQLGQGTDVAIVAWGPRAAAAAIAAEGLAQRGIGATVVNCRFAAPLDANLLAATCRSVALVVVIDDATSGGFASWVAECLIQRGISANLSILAIEAQRTDEPHNLHQQCAAAIVARCKWLADPIIRRNFDADPPVVPMVVGEQLYDPTCIALPSLEPLGGADVHLQVLAQQFSPFIERWVRDYARVGTRDVYLWRWCLHGLELTTLSCVAPELRQQLCDTKLLAVMYGVMLDDIADQAGNDDFLAALTKIIAGSSNRDFSEFSEQQQAYARFTGDLWDTFQSRLQSAPFYGEFADLLDYDHQQILNTFAYSCMINHQPALMNVQEHDMYLPHNMQMMSFATMDLMCSPGFDREELGKLREVVWHAQSMGRIGNLVSTWQREVADRDFTSGVFARALRQGDLTPENLRSASPEFIEEAVRRGEHEQFFLRKWEAHRQCISALAAGIRSVDISQLLSALEQLIRMELGSRGLK